LSLKDCDVKQWITVKAIAREGSSSIFLQDSTLYILVG